MKTAIFNCVRPQILNPLTLALVCLLLGASAARLRAAEQQVAIWQGGAQNPPKSYNDIFSWSGAAVPTNSAAITFTLLVNDGSLIAYDVDGANSVSSASFGAGSLFSIAGGRTFTIDDIAILGGNLSADGAGTRFTANSVNSAFGANSWMGVSNGAQMTLGPATYAWHTDISSPVTIMSADGDGSSLQLPRLQSISTPPYGYQYWNGSAYVGADLRINASNGGTIDFPLLNSVTGMRVDGYGRLVFAMDSGGTLTLPELKETHGLTEFLVDAPSFTIPKLELAENAGFQAQPNSTLNLPELKSWFGARGTALISEGAKINAPMLDFINVWNGDASFTIRTNGVFNAPALTQFYSGLVDVLSIEPGGSFIAPQMSTFGFSVLKLTPNITFQSAALTDISHSRFIVKEGAVFNSVAMPDYVWGYEVGSGAQLFRAEGAGSLLDLSKVKTIKTPVHVGGHFYIAGVNGGKVDLSNLETAGGFRTDVSGGRLIFHVDSDGQIDLAKLRTVSGASGFEVDVPNYTAPKVESFENTSVWVGQARHFNVPELKSMTGGWSTLSLDIAANFNAPKLTDARFPGGLNLAQLSVFDAPALTNLSAAPFNLNIGALFNAPNLKSFTDGSLTLSPGLILNAPAFENIDRSRLRVTSGAALTLAAASYNWTGPFDMTQLSAVPMRILQADGAGSRLDASSMRDMHLDWTTFNQIYLPNQGGWNYYTHFQLEASNHGLLDLSGTTNIFVNNPQGYGLIFSEDNDSDLRLDSLQTVTGFASFNLGHANRSVPNLETALQSSFNVAPGTTLTLPKLKALAGGWGGFNVPAGSRLNFEALEQFDAGNFGLNAGGTVNAPHLQSLTHSTISLPTGATFLAPALQNIDSSRLFVASTVTFSADIPSYVWNYPNSYAQGETIFSADGPAAVLNLSKLSNLDVIVQSGSCCDDDPRLWISARNGGLIDLSGLQSAHGIGVNWWGYYAPLAFEAASGGKLAFGNVLLDRRTQIRASGINSRVVAKGLNIQAAGGLLLQNGGTLEMTGDLTYGFGARRWECDSGTILFDGPGLHNFEVGGTDHGPDGFASGNFGFSKLLIGKVGEPSTVALRENVDNGGREGGKPEALYVFGGSATEDSLQIAPGSMLVLGNLNAYARVGGQIVSLQALIPGDQLAAQVVAGTIAKAGGVRVLSMKPSQGTLPPIDHIDIQFDSAIQAASLTTSDVTITGPAGAIPATTIISLPDNVYRLGFASQTADGNYAVTVGPAISDASGLLVGMDQNGNGIAGDADDRFVSSFQIDTAKPVVVSTAGIIGSGKIGVRFSKPMDKTSAETAANYSIDGVAAKTATLRPDGISVLLTVDAFSNATFDLLLSNVVDGVGNQIDSAHTRGTQTFRSTDVGWGGDPQVAGMDFTVSPAEYQSEGGGTDVWGGADHFHYEYEAIDGNFDKRVRVAYLEAVSAYNRAGLMVRDGLNYNDRMFYAFVWPAGPTHYSSEPTGANSWVTYVRTSPGAGISQAANPPGPVPYPNGWLRVKRDGNTFISYYGNNGVDWTEMYRTTMDFGSRVFFGLATNARNFFDPSDNAVADYFDYGFFAPIIKTQPIGQVAAVGSRVVLGVVAEGGGTLRYQWQLNELDVLGETGPTLTLSDLQFGADGSYRVKVSNAFGEVFSAPALVILADRTTNILASASGSFSLDRVHVYFTAPVTAISGSNPLNYSLDGGLAVAGVFLSPDRTHATVVTGRQTEGQTYQVTVNGVVEEAALAAIVPNSKVSFTAWQFTQGLAEFEVWTNIGGGAVSDLYGSPSFPESPSQLSYTASLSTPRGLGDNYGARVRGFVLPPVTGDYKFYDWSDDYSELYLSADDGPVHLTLISHAYSGWGVRADFPNASNPISLEAGQRYYFEAYLKEGGGDDYLNIGWRMPGEDLNQTAGMQPIPSQYLATYAEVAQVYPAVTEQPQSMEVAVGTDVKLHVTANGLAPLTYQWRFRDLDLDGENGAELSLPNVQPAQSGDYEVVITSPIGTITSQKAKLTVITTSPVLRLEGASGSPGSSVTVAVTINSQGIENALNFSVGYDTNFLHLTGYRVGGGLGGGALTVDTSKDPNIGVQLLLPASEVLGSGRHELALLDFVIPPGTTNSALTRVYFTNAPLALAVVDAAGADLTPLLDSATVEIIGFEGDVSPRPFGSGTVTVTDWTLIGRFVAGLETPSSPTEFMRIDCAPRSTGGNGLLSVADWVQAGRYAAKLDPLTPAHGPRAGLAQLAGPPKAQSLENASSLRFKIVSDDPSGIVVRVVLDSTGQENALGFSVGFDPSVLKFIGAGGFPAGLFANLNVNQAGNGRLGFALANSSGGSLPQGQIALAEIKLQPMTNVFATAFTFMDAPIVREAADPVANTLPLHSTGASLEVQTERFTDPQVDVSGFNARYAGKPGAVYEFQWSQDLLTWNPLQKASSATGGIPVADPNASARTRYYRAHPSAQ